MTTLVLLLVFVAAAGSAYLVIRPAGASAVVQQRLLAIRRHGGQKLAPESVVDEEMALPFAARVLGPTLERFYRWVIKLAPSRLQQGTLLKLAQAGSPVTASHFLGVRAITAGVAGLVGLLLSVPNLGQHPLLGFFMVAVFIVLGWTMPDFWLSRQISARRRLINRALPDVLDLLSISVEAGLGLDGAFQKVGEKFPEPTSGEFRELLKAIRLGTPRADALRLLAERTGLPDVRSFTAAIIQAEQLGVAVSRVLRTQADAMRVKRKQAVEEKAMALPLKMLFPLILFIFPTIFIIVLGPVVIGLVSTFSHK